ncbi:MAG TPA: GNAT family N-acetyltransferase [Puia sp.]|jgi:GNAT superfamily N-acetyltransferase|nr:GNAT family N-acetyltransferase [Puia sp.]
MMGDTVHIGIAARKEAELIADLSRRTFVDTFAPHNTPKNMDLFLNTQFTHKQLMDQVGAPGNTFLLARLDGEAVGYARLFEGTELPRDISGTKAIEVARIYAAQHVIGKGVGKALMQASIDLACQKGKEWIWLGVWEHNHRAIAFYEKMGFAIFDRHIFLLGQDVQYDWCMRRKL